MRGAGQGVYLPERNNVNLCCAVELVPTGPSKLPMSAGRVSRRSGAVAQGCSDLGGSARVRRVVQNGGEQKSCGAQQAQGHTGQRAVQAGGAQMQAGHLPARQLPCLALPSTCPRRAALLLQPATRLVRRTVASPPKVG